MKNLNFKATLISFVVAFFVAFAFTACGGASTNEEVAPAAEDVVAEDVVAEDVVAEDVVAEEGGAEEGGAEEAAE